MGHAGEFEILVMLAVHRLGSNAYGITIRNELEHETSRSLTLGTVYKTLLRLDAKGYLSSRTSAPSAMRGGRRKKLYELSPSGMEVVRRSLNDLMSLARELDLGLDSMERVELLTEVETRFGVRIGEEAAQRIYTVHDLVEAARPPEGVAGAQARLEDAWPTILSRQEDGDPKVSELFRSRLAAVVMFAALRMIYVFAWIFLGFRVRGLEHLPEKGPYLICPNHQSYVDGFLLSAALPFRIHRNMFIVGSSEYFETRVTRWFARMVRLIPVDPDTNLLRAMRVGAQGLRDGRILMLFPEGERSIDREIKRFKKGAAILSSNIGAPVVPIAIEGAYDVWPRTGSLRLSRLVPFVGRVCLTFGEPLTFETSGSGAAPDYRARSAELRSHVVGLLSGIREGR